MNSAHYYVLYRRRHALTYTWMGIVATSWHGVGVFFFFRTRHLSRACFVVLKTYATFVFCTRQCMSLSSLSSCHPHPHTPTPRSFSPTFFQPLHVVHLGHTGYDYLVSVSTDIRPGDASPVHAPQPSSKRDRSPCNIGSDISTLRSTNVRPIDLLRSSETGQIQHFPHAWTLFMNNCHKDCGVGGWENHQVVIIALKADEMIDQPLTIKPATTTTSAGKTSVQLQYTRKASFF